MVEVMMRMGMIMLTRVTWRGLVLCLNWSENNKWQDWTKIEVQIHGTPYQCTAKVSACSVTRYMYQQQLHFEQDIDQKQEERKKWGGSWSPQQITGFHLWRLSVFNCLYISAPTFISWPTPKPLNTGRGDDEDANRELMLTQMVKCTTTKRFYKLVDVFAKLSGSQIKSWVALSLLVVRPSVPHRWHEHLCQYI